MDSSAQDTSSFDDQIAADAHLAYTLELVDGVHKALSFWNIVHETRRYTRFTVDQCTLNDFEALRDKPEPRRLAALNPLAPFDNIEFHDVDPDDPTHTHYYLVPNAAAGGQLEEPRGSTTGFIHSFFEHFDEDEHASRIALQLVNGTRSGGSSDEYIRLATNVPRESSTRDLAVGSKRDVALRAKLRQYAAQLSAYERDAEARRCVDAAAATNEDLELYVKLRSLVLAHWKWGSSAGTALHRAIELFLDSPSNVDWSNPVYSTVEFKYFLQLCTTLFVHSQRPLRVLRSELRVADFADTRANTEAERRAVEVRSSHAADKILGDLLPATYLAGSVDFVAFDEHSQSIVLGDWKRSKQIYERSFGNKFGKAPCQSVPDCNLYHYYLQLNTYAMLIEMNSAYRVSSMFIAVFHPSNETFMRYDVPDMRTTVQRMLIERIKHNVRSVYVSSSDEDVRKRRHMQAYLDTKHADPTNLADLFVLASSHSTAATQRSILNMDTAVVVEEFTASSGL